MTISIYFDLLVSNERRASVNIRPLPSTPSRPDHHWAYEIKDDHSTSLGSVICNNPDPLKILLEVLKDWEATRPDNL